MSGQTGRLRRDLSQYAGCSPEAISNGSQAMVRFFIDDAKHDVATLATALTQCQRVLADLVGGDKALSTINIYAQAVEAETQARAALAASARQ